MNENKSDWAKSAQIAKTKTDGTSSKELRSRTSNLPAQRLFSMMIPLAKLMPGTQKRDVSIKTVLSIFDVNVFKVWFFQNFVSLQTQTETKQNVFRLRSPLVKSCLGQTTCRLDTPTANSQELLRANYQFFVHFFCWIQQAMGHEADVPCMEMPQDSQVSDKRRQDSQARCCFVSLRKLFARCLAFSSLPWDLLPVKTACAHVIFAPPMTSLGSVASDPSLDSLSWMTFFKTVVGILTHLDAMQLLMPEACNVANLQYVHSLRCRALAKRKTDANNISSFTKNVCVHAHLSFSNDCYWVSQCFTLKLAFVWEGGARVSMQFFSRVEERRNWSRLSTLPNLCFWLCSATDKQQTNNLQSIKELSTLLQQSRGSGGGKKGSKWKDRDGDETQTKNRDASGCYRWHHGVGIWLYVNFLGTCWCVASTTVCGDFKAHRDLFVFNFSIDLLSPPARNHWPFSLLLGLVGLESIFQMLNCSEKKVATSCHLRLLCRPRHKSCAESKNLPASSTNSWIQELTHFFLSFFRMNSYQSFQFLSTTSCRLRHLLAKLKSKRNKIMNIN